MLIAMMGNTYAIVNEKSEKEFLKQVITLARNLSHSGYELVPSYERDKIGRLKRSTCLV